MNCTFCCMPLGQLLHLLILPLGQVNPLQPMVDGPGGFGLGHLLEVGHEAQEVLDLHLAVEAALLGQVADDVGGGPGRRCCP